MAPAILVGSPEDEGKEFIAVTVSNISEFPTTVTHFLLADYEDWLDQARSKQSYSAIIPNPSRNPSAPGVPSLLNAGEEWQGMCLLTEELRERALNGRLHVGVQVSHFQKPLMKRVVIPDPKSEGDS
ncbi:MAG: hypothetical protein ACU0GG_19630 [Paracoccaceae bacterium]